jgi:hypothetical protein
MGHFTKQFNAYHTSLSTDIINIAFFEIIIRIPRFFYFFLNLRTIQVEFRSVINTERLILPPVTRTPLFIESVALSGKSSFSLSGFKLNSVHIQLFRHLR